MLRPIHIGHDSLQQAHALQDARLNVLPMGRLNDQGEQIQCPGPLGAVLIGVDVVGYPVVTDLMVQVAEPVVKFLRTLVGNMIDELAPNTR